MGSTLVHAWLHTDARYRERVLRALGVRAFKAYSPSQRHPVAGGGSYEVDSALGLQSGPGQGDLLAAGSGTAVLCCTQGDLAEAGLPSTWLTPVGWCDRIGLDPVPGPGGDLTSFPALAELLRSCRIVVFPSGEHCTECLVASLSLSQDELALLVCQVSESLGWRASFLGVISGQEYESVYRRSP